MTAAPVPSPGMKSPDAIVDALVRAWREKSDPLAAPVLKSERTHGDGLLADEVEFSLRTKEHDPEWLLRFRMVEGWIRVGTVRPGQSAHGWAEVPDIDSAVVEMASFIADFEGSRGTGLEQLSTEGIGRVISELT